MDKKKQKTTLSQILEKEERTEERKRRRKTKRAEPEASLKSSNSELKQQQTRPGELTDTNTEQSDGNVRMKIAVGAKRMKKPPKSLENFICRPTIRISQRLAHGDGHSSSGGEVSSSGVRVAKQSQREIQKKSSNDCISQKGSKKQSLPLHTSPKKGDSTPVISTSKKASSKNTRKTDSKLFLTSDGPSYAVQPQTHSKVPLSDKITSSALLKQTYSPPAARSPPSSLQQNSSPQDCMQVLNAQKEVGEDVPTGKAMTPSLCSQGSKDMTLNIQISTQSSSSLENDSESTLFPKKCTENSVKETPCPPKKTSKIRESNAEEVSNANQKEDGDSECFRNMCNTINNNRSKENGLLHQPSPSIKTPLLLSASDKSAESVTTKNRTCTPELPESRGRNKKHNENEVINDNKPAQIVTVQPENGIHVGNVIDKNKNRDRHSSNQEDDMQCFSQTHSCAEPHLQKKQKTVQMTNITKQGENDNVNSTDCKMISKKSKVKKKYSMKSSKGLSSQQSKLKPVGLYPKSKELQNTSPRSENSSLEPPCKKRGRPKMNRLDEFLQGSKTHKSFPKLPILEHSIITDPKDNLKLPKPRFKIKVHPKTSSAVQTKKTKSLGSVSGKKAAEGKLKPSLSKARDAQICRERNRLIMKTIIKNINKMRVKRKDKVLRQFLSGQNQTFTNDFVPEDNEGNVDCSISDSTHSLSSLVTSFGGKLAPQINVSKRGTIYIGKRRGRKPKTQTETSVQESGQILGPKSQQVLAESSNQLNSWSSSGERSHSFDSQSVLGSSSYSFKHHMSPSNTVSSFRRKLYPGNHEYDQHSAPKETSSQRVKAIPEEKSKPPSSLQLAPCPSATSQIRAVRIQDHRTNLAQSVLMEQERLNYKCHRKSHDCFSHDKMRRHKHKCKKRYLQLRTKRQDPAFLAEIEELVVRLSEIRIVHHISSRGSGDEAKSGRKSGKGKAHPYVLQCLPQNLHHPTMFQINFSGYYSPQSDFSRDSLHYVGMADFKRNNGCPSQAGEHIVTHCPVVHKLGFPLSGGGCYHPPYKMPLSTTSFGFGLYRGYPPSATIYPSSPFLPSYVHPYSKNPILSPSKFHKRTHKFLRHDTELYSGKLQGTNANVTSHPSSDWFNRNSWQRKGNREQSRDKIFVNDRLSEREGKDGLLGHSKLRKDHFRRDPSTNSPCSSSAQSKQADKHKTSPFSYIGPVHLRPVSNIRWAEHQQPWRWRESSQEPRNRGLNQEAGSGYQEEDDEGNKDLPSPPLEDRPVHHHHSFLRNSNIASSAYGQMTTQSNAGEVQCSSRNVMRPGRSVMESCSTGGKRTSESFQPGGSLFREHYSHASLSLNEEQEKGGQEKRPNIRKTPILTNNIGLFTSCSANKSSLSQLNNSKNTTPNNDKLKHVKKPLRNKTPKGQEVTGREVKRRGRGRPRKNPSPCFSPPPSVTLLDHGVKVCPAKHKKGEKEVCTALDVIESMTQHEKKKRKKNRDETRSHKKQVEALIQEPSYLHTETSLPSLDQSVSFNRHLKNRSAEPHEKTYEWAGLYSNVYKRDNPISLSSSVHTDCLEYNPEEHEHGLLPAPLHVGMYLRLKRIDFQLPYEIYELCAQKKHPKKSKTPRKKALSNGSVDVMSHIQTEDSSCNPHKNSVNHDCVSDSTNRNVTDHHIPPTDEPGEEMSDKVIVNKLPNQSDSPKQQVKGNDAENPPSPLLMMPLSCEERSFVLEHGIFLVRNYEKMRDRQTLFLREEVTEPGKEVREDGGSSHSQKGDFEDTSIKSEQLLPDSRLQTEGKAGDEEGSSVQSRNLMQTLQGIYDVIVSHKGSSGQTLAAPLFNLCSRKRSGSAPVDLSTLEKKLLSGHYQSLDVFHSDMLKVFHCAEKYYGCESSVGRNVRQLRDVFHTAHQEALTHTGSFLPVTQTTSVTSLRTLL